MLDLAGHGRYCLLIGIDGQQWEEAAAKVAADLGVELPVHRVGARCDYDDVYGEWAAVREISDAGCLLIRPDQHIAWRAQRPGADPTTELMTVLRQVLHLAGPDDRTELAR
jgi:2,4-dichlorophenol 6-monooxygenase